MLDLADARRELGVVQLQGPAIVEDQGIGFARGHQVWHLIQQPFGEQQPIERLAEHQVVKLAVADHLGRQPPHLHGIQDGFEPVLSARHGLAHAKDGLIHRGEVGPLAFHRFKDNRLRRSSLRRHRH